MGLTFQDALTLPLNLGIVAGSAVFYAIQAPFRGEDQVKKYWEYVRVKTVNCLVGRLGAGELQSVFLLSLLTLC
jgi:hypothetical protein